MNKKAREGEKDERNEELGNEMKASTLTINAKGEKGGKHGLLTPLPHSELALPLPQQRHNRTALLAESYLNTITQTFSL